MKGFVLRLAIRIFGGAAERTLAKYPEMGQDFLKARILIHPRAYVALTYLLVASTATFGLLLGFLFAGFVGASSPAKSLGLALVQAGLAGLLCYIYMWTYPQLRINARAKRIDAMLPYALNFVSSLSSAGTIPHKVFGALAQQREYGLVADEARWIYRDVEMLGLDVIDALLEGSRRSASRQFAEFLQGTVSTILSGGNLPSYFLQKANQSSENQRRLQRGYVDNLGLLAESYIVAAVAGPLFLIVIVSVLTLLGGRSVDPLKALRVIIFLILPASHFMFAALINRTRPEA